MCAVHADGELEMESPRGAPARAARATHTSVITRQPLSIFEATDSDTPSASPNSYLSLACTRDRAQRSRYIDRAIQRDRRARCPLSNAARRLKHENALVKRRLGRLREHLRRPLGRPSLAVRSSRPSSSARLWLPRAVLGSPPRFEGRLFAADGVNHLRRSSTPPTPPPAPPAPNGAPCRATPREWSA